MLTSTGFSVPTLQEIRDDLGVLARARIASDLDLSDYSVVGQLLGIIAEELHTHWLTERDIWASQNISSATGQSLTELCALTGTIREGARASTVLLTLTLDPGVTVTAGTQLRVPGSTTAVWQTTATVSYTHLTLPTNREV